MGEMDLYKVKDRDGVLFIMSCILLLKASVLNLIVAPTDS